MLKNMHLKDLRAAHPPHFVCVTLYLIVLCITQVIDDSYGGFSRHSDNLARILLLQLPILDLVSGRHQEVLMIIYIVCPLDRYTLSVGSDGYCDV